MYQGARITLYQGARYKNLTKIYDQKSISVHTSGPMTLLSVGLFVVGTLTYCLWDLWQATREVPMDPDVSDLFEPM